MNTRLRIAVLFVSCLLLWLGSILVRLEVRELQTQSLGGKEALFLKESALQFRMTRQVWETGTLPEHEPKVGVPEGVVPRETYSVGAEWIYSAVARWLPESLSLSERIRRVSTALFSFAIPFAFLWTWVRTRSLLGSSLTGLILMVSPAFAVRSSGLELSRENLSIPLFLLFFAASATSGSSEQKSSRWLWGGLAAVSVSLAQCFWDLSQMAFGLWGVFTWFREFRHPDHDHVHRPVWLLTTGALLLAGLLNPYLRTHGFLFSPVMGLYVARSVGWIPAIDRFKKGRWLLFLAVGVSWILIGRLFQENYSHFGELLWAKLRFGNVKPVDPSLLTYVQRIMWTPALNSSTWSLTKAYFAITLYAGLIAAVALLHEGLRPKAISKDASGSPVPLTEVYFLLFTLPVYVLFFRFHIFLIVFLAVCVGIAVGRMVQVSKEWPRMLIAVILILLITGVEMYHLLFFDPANTEQQRAQRAAMRQMLEQAGVSNPMLELPDNRWGSGSKLEYPYTEALLTFLNEELQHLDPADHSDPPAMLANFGVSATVLSYTGIPIVLHPKFETPGIREKVGQFYEHLYLEDERSFRNWALEQGARYYLHSQRDYERLVADVSLEIPITPGSQEELRRERQLYEVKNSPPYMVNALPPPKTSAWNVLQNHPDRLTWFVKIQGPFPRYTLYRIITPQDEENAGLFTRRASYLLRSGDLEGAEDFAKRAQELFPRYEPAMGVRKQVILRRNSSSSP